MSVASGVSAEVCPVAPPPHLPDAPQPLNIDTVKSALRQYHDDGTYMRDIAAVVTMAKDYVEQRTTEAKKPAVVLDIDETSLSNWEDLSLDDFGYIKSGPCPERKNFACGFNSWIAKGTAAAIVATRDFYDALRAKHVPVFFITGRTDSQRDITIKNLRRAGYRDWAGLATRPDDDAAKHDSVVPFKSGERAKIVKQGYDVLATIGDQQNDIDGGSADCGFKLPNPYYFIK
jgi:predicted secreted acid phosphatase